MSSEVENYEVGLTWHKFLKAFCAEHSITYGQGMCDPGARECWKEYKELHAMPPSKSKVQKLEPKVIKHKEVPINPTSKLGEGVRRRLVRVKAPPPGYKLKVKYVVDSDSSSDSEEEVVKPKVKPPPGKADTALSKGKKAKQEKVEKEEPKRTVKRKVKKVEVSESEENSSQSSSSE